MTSFKGITKTFFEHPSEINPPKKARQDTSIMSMPQEIQKQILFEGLSPNVKQSKEFYRKVSLVCKSWREIAESALHDWIYRNHISLGSELGFQTLNAALEFAKKSGEKLKALHLHSFRISSENLTEVIKTCTSIRGIMLNNCPLLNNNLLEKLKFCEEISLENCLITNEFLNQCSKLQTLCLKNLFKENEELIFGVVSNPSQLSGELPPSLKRLFFHSNHITKLSQLPFNLTELNVSYSIELQELPETLPVTLQILNISNCGKIKKITKLPEKLSEFYLTNCSSLQELPKNMPDGILHLDLTGCISLTKLPEKLPIDLETLILNNCNSSKELPQLPKKLKKLDLETL